jgi:hypothetical protein
MSTIPFDFFLLFLARASQKNLQMLHFIGFFSKNKEEKMQTTFSLQFPFQLFRFFSFISLFLRAFF